MISIERLFFAGDLQDQEILLNQDYKDIYKYLVNVPLLKKIKDFIIL